MTKTTTIYLKLIGTKPNYQLQWSSDQRTWTKVNAGSPSNVVDSDDVVEWLADDSIDKVKIKFSKGNIIPNGNIKDNDSKKPKGTVISNVGRKLSDSYTIKVKPSAGGASSEYDPDIQTPQGGG